MSDYNWCHGPECHTRETSSRVRGSGRDKVLRTRKVNTKHYWRTGQGSWTYFCDDTCMRGYLEKHIQAIIAIAPRRKALETPIKVVKEKQQCEGSSYNHETREYTSYPYTTTKTTISRVDNG